MPNDERRKSMKIIFKLGRTTHWCTLWLILLSLFLSGRCYAQSKTGPDFDVSIVKGDSVDFMAKHWKWPAPAKWDDMLKEKIAQAITAIGYNGVKTPSKLKTAPEFGWITMVSFNSSGGLGGVPSKDGGYQMQYAEVYLRGELVIQGKKEVTVPYTATRVMFSPDEDFIPALFDGAVVDLVSHLALDDGNQEEFLKWIWQRRNRMPQGTKHRHVEPNPKAKVKEPKEVIFEVDQPGPTIWDVLLRVRSKSSLDKILDKSKGSEPNIQEAIAHAFKLASSEPALKTFFQQYVSAIKDATKEFQGEAKENMKEALRTLQSPQ
jgi:hypothetical protein